LLPQVQNLSFKGFLKINKNEKFKIWIFKFFFNFGGFGLGLTRHRTPGSRDECRTAPDDRRSLDQAHRLQPWARLKAAKKLHPLSPSLLLSPKADTHLPSHRG